jgi:hypothetical protein
MNKNMETFCLHFKIHKETDMTEDETFLVPWNYLDGSLKNISFQKQQHKNYTYYKQIYIKNILHVLQMNAAKIWSQ